MVEAPVRRRDLDLGPLTRGAGVRACLRALGRQPLWIMATTLGAIMVAMPVVWVTILLATGNDTSGEGLFGGALVLLGGLWVMLDLVLRVRGAGAWVELARVNDLELLTGTTMPHYAAPPFARGSCLVLQGVRTREERFVEVGDRFPIKVPRRPEDHPEPELYLRARLAGRAGLAPYGVALVTPELDEALTELAGPYTVDVTRDELTVLGTSPLGPREPDRVARAFALVDALVARADALLVEPHAGRGDAPTASGIPVPELAPHEVVEGRPASASKVVGLTLALMTVLPLGLAVVGSSLEGSLRGNTLGATVLVSLFLAVTFALVVLLVRTISRPRRGRGRGRRG